MPNAVRFVPRRRSASYEDLVRARERLSSGYLSKAYSELIAYAKSALEARGATFAG